MLVRTFLYGLTTLLAAASVASAGGPAPLGDDGPELPGLRLLSSLSLRAVTQDDYADDYEGDDGGMTDDNIAGMHVVRRSEYEQGLTELRLTCYIWQASMDAVSEVSSGEMRLAEALKNLHRGFGTSIQHIDFVEEMELDRSRIIINPEISLRFNNSCFRLSWWYFKESKRVLPSKIYAYGDVVYAVDPDGELVENRVPPDSYVNAQIPEIQFSAELMDLKLIYEMRLKASASLEVFAGLSVHWFRYSAVGNTEVRVFSARAGGAIKDRERVDDEQLGDYPLITLSCRVEWRPYGNYYFLFDLQEMYLYFGNYTDLKLGVWNQIVPYVRVGIGYRLWNARAELYNLGGNKMNVDTNVVLTGLWGGIHIIF